MSLQRTNYGLTNEHLFYDVAMVVYCEGKESADNTHDEMFWGRLLSNFGISCVCKSRGSKSNIVPLAFQARDGNVRNVIFAMDRDYGDYKGLPIEDQRVVYTYGYSWENDILLGLDAEAIFSMFAPMAHDDPVANDLVSFIEASSESNGRVACLDIRNSVTDKALFDRDKPVSIFVGAGPDLRFNEAALQVKFEQIAALQEVPEFQGNLPVWIQVFFGKACARLIYQWFVDRSQAYANKSRIPYDAFLRLCVSTMRFDPEAAPRDIYYRDAVARLSP